MRLSWQSTILLDPTLLDPTGTTHHAWVRRRRSRASSRKWAAGSTLALEQLTPLVYGELRALAAGYLRRERADHTLQPTALVHEAYLRLVDQHEQSWESRHHFYGVAAHLMQVSFTFVDGGAAPSNDTALITVTDAQGSVVFSVSGVLTQGKIQAQQ